MIELYLLEQLDAFARLGTLSAASKELHISQPALTRSMKKLEGETGMILFDREGRRISLNEGGRIAARHAALILNQEKEMKKDLEDWQRSQNTVSIASCAPMPLARIMPAMQLQFPGKSILTEIRDNDETLIQDLKQGKIQIAILHEVPVASGIFCQRYLHENICVFVKKAHSLAHRKSISLKELSKYSILISRHIGFWLPLSQQKLPSSSLLVQDSMDVMDELAESSSTPMFNSDAMIKDGYDSGDRVAIPITDSCMHAVYYAACPESHKETLRIFFNEIRAEALKDQ